MHLLKPWKNKLSSLISHSCPFFDLVSHFIMTLSLHTNPHTAHLPILSLLPDIQASLEEHSNIVIIAPPGAGKTTTVPLCLLSSSWLEAGQKVLMLEPRRLAARGAAHRMAQICNEVPGQRIGFRTRFESAVSAQTRIEVITEGLLMKRLMEDPLLEDVGGIIFDEIHERSLTCDLAAACCLDLQRTIRPELRLIAMSATIDGAAFSKTFQGPILETQGNLFPVDLRHVSSDIFKPQELPKKMCQAILGALSEESGNILAFLPGAGSIHRTLALLEEQHVTAECLPLYGDLPLTDQDYALKPSPTGMRRVILATSIAETSLTVPDIRIVIDGGFRNIPLYDPDSGLTRRKTVRISKAAADQRAGRAGRVSEGICIRLWSAAIHRGLSAFETPEILNADLSGLCLYSAAWEKKMGTPLTGLPLLDHPSKGAIEAGQTLLNLLGATTPHHAITPFGLKMAHMGSHPRFSAMMLAARDDGEKMLACFLAALLEERDPLRPQRQADGRIIAHPPADISLRLDLLIHGVETSPYDRPLVRRIQQVARQYAARLGTNASATGDTALLLAAAFPDRIAQRRSEAGSFRLAEGGSARLPKSDAFAHTPLLAVATLHIHKAAEIRMAAELEIKTLPSFLLERCTTHTDMLLDPVTGAIMGHQRVRLGKLILQEKTIPLQEEEIRDLLKDYIQNNFEEALPWNDETAQFQARIDRARNQLNRTDLPDLSMQSLASHIEDWLSPYIHSFTHKNALKTLSMHQILQDRLDYNQRKWLETHLPTHLPLQGKMIPIDYTQAHPSISVRAQLLYGLRDLPPLGEGKLPLQINILSPAGRVQAITSDLGSFWKNGWLDMRRDMKGRYPKHSWPEDPSQAPH